MVRTQNAKLHSSPDLHGLTSRVHLLLPPLPPLPWPPLPWPPIDLALLPVVAQKVDFGDAPMISAFNDAVGIWHKFWLRSEARKGSVGEEWERDGNQAAEGWAWALENR